MQKGLTATKKGNEWGDGVVIFLKMKSLEKLSHQGLIGSHFIKVQLKFAITNSLQSTKSPHCLICAECNAAKQNKKQLDSSSIAEPYLLVYLFLLWSMVRGIEEGWTKKQGQRSSRQFGGHILFNSMQH